MAKYSGSRARAARITCIQVTTLAAAVMVAMSSYAYDEWTGSSGSNWGDAANWATSSVPYGAGTDVRFLDSDANLNGKTITLGADRTLGQLLVGSAMTSQVTFSISGNTLTFNNNGAQSVLSLSGNRSLTVNSAMVAANSLKISNSSAYAGSISLAGNVNMGGNALEVDAVNGASVTVSGAISNAGGVTKSGLGTLNLTGANTFGGNFNFNAGTVGVGNNAAFGTSTIVLAAGGNQKFDLKGSYTLTNALTLGDTLAVSGSGNTLTFNGANTTAVTGVQTFDIGNVATLAFGARHSLSGTGSINKTGYGTLVLGSAANTFSGGLNIQSGAVATGSFSDTLTIGGSGTNTMLGTGNITVDSAGTTLTLNGTAAASVNFAGGSTTVSNQAVLQVTNGATVNLNSGTVDLGGGTGSLNFSGNVVAGNTSLVNATGANLYVGKNLTFNSGSTIAASGVNFVLNGTGAQTVYGSGVLTGMRGLTMAGSGIAVIDAGISGMELTSLSADAGELRLGTTAITTPVVNIGSGTLSLGMSDQLGAGTAALNSTGSGTLNLNGRDQSFLSLGSAGGGTLTVNMGTAGSSNILGLGTILGLPGTLRVGGWEGTLSSATDHVYTSSSLTADQLANIWFLGFGKGAILTSSGELMPAGNLSSEWNGLASNLLWGDGGNWVGGDAYNVPDHAGASATFGNLAGSLSGKTINLGGQNRTVGNLMINSSASTASTSMTFSGGRIVFDSGDAATPATLTATSRPWPIFSNGITLNSDLVVNTDSLVYLYDITGSKSITKNGAGALRFFRTLTGFSGDIILNTGSATLYADNALGSGTLYVNGGTVGGAGSNVKYTIGNALVIGGNFSANYARFTQVGDVDLSQTRTITVSGDSIIAGEVASVTFGTGVNFTGTGGLTKAGAGTMEILSAGSTFSGGLTVSAGTLYTTLGSDLTIGTLSVGHNYLGSGNVTVNSSGTLLVDSAGYAATLADSVLQLANARQLQYLGGGSFTLAGGTLNGGTSTSRGTLLVSGDLIFGGTTFVNTPNITVDTTTNLTGNTTIYGSGSTISGLNTFTKQGSGTTVLDASVTSFAPNNLYIGSGVLQLSTDGQLGNSINFVLNGGTLDLNNHTQTLKNLYLRNDSSILLGSTGGLTINSRMTGSTDWVDGKVLTLQNNGQDWHTGVTYVRFAADPLFGAAQLGNIAFTGYESGAVIDTGLFSGYWTLLPDPAALPTNEWIGTGSSLTLWSDAGNWLSNTVPDAPGASVSIRDADPALDGKTIEVDGNYTIGRLNIEAGSGQDFTIGGNHTLTIEGDNARIRHAGVNTTTLASNIQLNSDIGLINDVAPTVGQLNWTGTVSGTGSITRTGAGTLQLAGNAGSNSYTGGFVWQDASLIQVNASGSVFGTGMLMIGDGSNRTYTLETTGGSHTVSTPYTLAGNLTLQKDTVNGTTITDDIGLTHTLTFSGAGMLTDGMHTVNVYANNANVTSGQTERLALVLNDVISGTGGMLKTGAGDLVLNSTNTFSGGFTFSTGRVLVAADNAFGTGLLTLGTGAAYYAQLAGTTGSAGTPQVFNNPLNVTGSLYLTGYLKFDYDGVSNITGSFGIGQSSASDLVIFGKNHVLSGTGAIRRGVSGSYSSGGTVRFEGANTYSGGTYTFSGVTQVGTDSIVTDGTLISGALGTGAVYLQGGTLGAYSDAGSGITSRRLSNQIILDTNSATFGVYGDAKTLILDTPTITLRSSKLDWTATVNSGATLSIASQLVDGSSPGGITKAGAGTLELTNGDNRISDGIRVSAGTLLASATGDVTTGILDAGHNYWGTGRLLLDAGTARINTADGSTVRLSGNGMNIAGLLTITGGTGITTLFDSNSTFTGTGTIQSTGSLIKTGEGTTTSISTRLVTPELELRSGTLSLTSANLVSGVSALNMNGGTLALNGLKQTFGSSTQLALNGSSTIDFGDGASTFTIGSLQLSSDGKYVGSSAYTLSVDNWSGNAASGGITDLFIVLSGVSAGQKLQNVWFAGGYTPGAKVLMNPYGQFELVPLGTSFIWDNHSNNKNWAQSNWVQPGAPGGAGDGATFGDLDSSLDGSTINIAGTGTTVGSISFESTQGQAFTLAGGPIALDTGDAEFPAQIRLVGNSSPTISSNLSLAQDLVLSQQGTGELTIAGAIAGPNRTVTKVGEGTLVLSSSESNFTNGMVVKAGTVAITASSAEGAGGGVEKGPLGIGTLVLDSGALEARNGDQTLHNAVNFNADFSVVGTNTLTLAGTSNGSNNAILNNDVTMTIADAAGQLILGEDLTLRGDYTITKDGAGTLTLAGNNNAFTGGIDIAAGVVEANSDTAIGTGSVTFTGNSTLATGSNVSSLDNNVVINVGVTGSVDSQGNDLTLDGVVSGAGTLNKVGTGDLVLTNSNSYSGGTLVSAGNVILENAAGAGTGTVALALGAGLEAAFDDGDLANVLSGAGSVTVSGSDVRISADNSGLTGSWNITGEASYTDNTNLGGAAVNITGSLTLSHDGDYTFANTLTGTGELNLGLTSKDQVMSFGSGVGSSFTGTVNLGTGTFNLNSRNTAPLAGATLAVNTGNTTNVMAGTYSVGNVTMGGGALGYGFNHTTTQATGTIAANDLDLSAGGGVYLDYSTNNSGAGLLVADDGVLSTLITTAGTVTGDASDLYLVDRNGNAITGNIVVGEITQGGNVVAEGGYQSVLSSDNNGLYLTATLTQVDIKAGQILSLDEGSGTGTAAELIARVTGSGNLSIDATTSITLSNAGNNYTGTTTVNSGTLIGGVANVLKNTGALIIGSATAFDLGGFAQEVNDLSGAGTVTLGSNTLTVNSKNDTTFAGVIAGTGNLIKTGDKELTLSGTNTYMGGTTISAGSLKLAQANSAGSSTVTIGSSGALDLAFDAQTFVNTLAGNGTTHVTGNDITIGGTNSGYAGNWHITGSATISENANLGSGTVNLDGLTSQLSVAPTIAGNYTFVNTLTGNGTLSVDLADAGDNFSLVPGAGAGFFSLASRAGTGFDGTVDMLTGHFDLDSSAAALANGTLKLSAAGSTTIDSDQSIKGLILNGGTLNVVMDGYAPAGILSVKDLDATGGATVAIDLPSDLEVPNVPTELSFFEQDDGALFKIVDASDSVAGVGSHLNLTDENGNSIESPNKVVSDITDGSSTLIARATYDYTANVLEAGIYIGYGLAELNVQNGQTLVLENPGTGSVSANTLGAKLTGDGNIDIRANGTAILANAGNDYTGKTTVSQGTLQLGTTNALGQTSELLVLAGATADINGMTQTVGRLTNAGIVEINGGTLTSSGALTNSGTVNLGSGTLNLADGGSSTGTLAGAGYLNVTGGTLRITGSNSSLSATTDISSGATVELDNALGLGTGAINHAGDLDIHGADGTLANSISGAGQVNLADSTLVLGGNNSNFSGIFNLDATSSVTVSTADNLGAATVNNDGIVTVASNSDWILNNTVNGAGALIKTGSGTVTVTGTNTYTGGTQINGGTLAISQDSNLGDASGTVGLDGGTLEMTAQFTSARDIVLGSNNGKLIGNDNTLSGSISGAGGLITEGTLTLTGDANHTGGTLINSGSTLSIGDGGMSGSISGNITTEGELIFNRSDSTSFAGNINGSGTVTKTGEGTLILTGTATHTGGTAVNDGTLQIGDGNLSGWLDGDISNEASVVFNRGDTVVYGGVISGTGDVTQQGPGTLILTRDQTYTGTTTIMAGSTLQLGDGSSSSGMIGADVANDGTLIFNHQGEVNYAGVISGTGDLIKEGSAWLTLDGVNAITGTTTVQAGTLIIGGPDSSNAQLRSSVVTIENGATLSGQGTITGPVSNSGVIASLNALADTTNIQYSRLAAGNLMIDGNLTMTSNGRIDLMGGTVGNTLTVAGNYSSDNGLIRLNTVLGGDDSVTDRLIVAGDTDGVTRMQVTNVGGEGSLTVQGIRVVDIGGLSNGTFTLEGRAVAGAYEYDLVKDSTDGNWYLRSESEAGKGTGGGSSGKLRPEVGSYLGNQSAANDMFVLSLNDRRGNSNHLDDEVYAWSRMYGSKTTGYAGNGQLDMTTSTWVVQVGTDVARLPLGQGQLHIGVMGGFGQAKMHSNARDVSFRSDGKVNGRSAGVYATWYRQDADKAGPYVDTWVQYGRYNNTVTGEKTGSQSYDSHNVAASVEGGWSVLLSKTADSSWFVEPRAQLIHTWYSQNDVHEQSGTYIRSQSVDGFLAKAGVRVYGNNLLSDGSRIQPFVEANWLYNKNGSAISYESGTIHQDMPKNQFELKLGLQAEIGKAWNVWGNIGVRGGQDHYRQVQGQIGVKYAW